MFIERIPLQVFGANCYILSAAETGPCVVVDPGAEAALAVRSRLAQHNWEVAAVLLTHGHPDHVWDCERVAQGAPVFIPAPGAHRLEDPLQSLGMPVANQLFAQPWCAPQHVHELHDSGQLVELAPGVQVKMVPAPGHTEGSALFFFAGPINSTDSTTYSAAPIGAFTGDVIFQGSVGRTDLPGGDDQQQQHTLRTLINAVDPQTFLLPGHGPTTTMAAEVESNPYLRQARFTG